MSINFEELDFRPTPMGVLRLRRRRRPSSDVDICEIKPGDEILMSPLVRLDRGYNRVDDLVPDCEYVRDAAISSFFSLRPSAYRIRPRAASMISIFADEPRPSSATTATIIAAIMMEVIAGSDLVAPQLFVPTASAFCRPRRSLSRC